MTYGIAYCNQDDKGFTETGPYVEILEDSRFTDAALRAKALRNRGFQSVAVFICDAYLPELVTWEYVYDHLVR